MTRVLVVDDEIDTLNLLRTILELSGYEPITTLNSVDAITLADVERPDLIMLDIMMPQLDGFTLCKMMRMHPSTANLPIVFVTAYSALDLEDRRKEAGADMVLPKPIGMDVLIDAVQKASVIRAPKPQVASVAESGNDQAHETTTPAPTETPSATVPAATTTQTAPQVPSQPTTPVEDPNTQTKEPEPKPAPKKRRWF